MRSNVRAAGAIPVRRCSQFRTVATGDAFRRQRRDNPAEAALADSDWEWLLDAPRPFGDDAESQGRLLRLKGLRSAALAR